MPAAPPLPSSQPAVRQPPKSPNAVLAETEAQWIFTPEELANTPSIQHGMSPADERDIRAKGVTFIVQAGIMLKLPQLTLSTAAIFFQRFLMRASLKREHEGIPKLHHYQAAATCLFLATKVEESGRKMKEMILTFCRVAQKNPNLIIDEQSKDFWKWRDSILLNEDVLLETLCFDLTIESPHRLLFELLKFYGVEHNKQLRNQAWSFVTDADSTQLGLLCSSKSIAVAGLYAACRYCGVALPDDTRGRPWWEIQKVKLADVRKALDHMCANYEQVQKAAVPNGPPTNVTGGDGGKSMYQGLSTLVDGPDDSWDSTRLKAEAPPPGSERRHSNASSIGVKRDREDTNGDSREARDETERKRTKLEDERGINGKSDAPAVQPLKDDSGDLKQREEKLRIENANRQAEEEVKASEQTQAQDAVEIEREGSEEGEVEE
ncbi:Hypothetical protein R9X50_00488000 [Acrodontium crateriforme]|uniref:RNA polymerase II holoenzyme cyclin-like subunit n=1 Tax=Acrodontium crateriforme TaxID=150365 RepID=A0AAQ3RB48_9PEZI|nr:Hypothetical protein R9X50_00488000 [Acrodontium crateriforme]